MHGRSKHIDVRFHFLRDLTKDRVIQLLHCSSQDKLADIMTKPFEFSNILQIERQAWNVQTD